MRTIIDRLQPTLPHSITHRSHHLLHHHTHRILILRRLPTRLQLLRPILATAGKAALQVLLGVHQLPSTPTIPHP